MNPTVLMFQKSDDHDTLSSSEAYRVELIRDSAPSGLVGFLIVPKGAAVPDANGNITVSVGNIYPVPTTAYNAHFSVRARNEHGYSLPVSSGNVSIGPLPLPPGVPAVS